MGRRNRGLTTYLALPGVVALLFGLGIASGTGHAADPDAAAEPDATVTATTTATTTVTTTATSSATATHTAPTATASATVTTTTTATATTTSTATTTAYETVDVTPDPEPTVTTTTTVTPGPSGDIYQTPGLHNSGGRKWLTVCEPYSDTHRCWTYIWGTAIHHVGGDRFVASNEWVFNNLTYVASPRSLWVGNPLATPGTWRDAEGRDWRTDCETEETGRNGCRTWVTTKVAAATGDGYGFVRTEQFNNIVRFR